jgi:hypothetical protein
LYKHFDANHPLTFKKFQEKINNQGRKNIERQLAKKKGLDFQFSIFEFLALKDPFKKNDMEQKMFVENLTFLIVKNHLPLQFVDSVWLKHLMLRLCLHVQFPS